MALNKTRTTGYGIDAAYWRVVGYQVHYDIADSVAVDVTIMGYPNKASRDAEVQPLDVVNKRITFGANADVTRANVYPQLKTLDEFENATDV
tara:strand:+ start:293 stop:568 length:276 start_codon:yes stop_codon:yes gene_type:complete